MSRQPSKFVDTRNGHYSTQTALTNLKKANTIFQNPLQSALTLLSLLMAAKPMTKYVGLLIRDVGPMHYLDWRARDTCWAFDSITFGPLH